MSVVLQGLHDMKPNKLIPIDQRFPYVWVFGEVLLVQSQGIYSIDPGKSAMLLYSEYPALQEPVRLTDGKTLTNNESGLEFRNVRGGVSLLRVIVEQQAVPFEVSFEIQHVSFFKNFHTVQNVSSESSNTIVFETVDHMDQDHTFLLDFATNDSWCGDLQVGDVKVSLPDTGMERKQFAIEVYEAHMKTRLDNHTQTINERFPSGEIRLNAKRIHPWSRLIFWNLEFLHGIPNNNNHEQEPFRGTHNVCIGNDSGPRDSKGDHNLFVGHGTGVSGRNNVSLGNNAKQYTGNDNVFLGNNTGCNGTNNIWISGSTTETVYHDSIRIGSLVSGNMDARELTVHGTLTTEDFNTKQLEVDYFSANTGNMEQLEIDYFSANTGNMEQLEVDYFSANFSGNINKLSANVSNVDYLSANVSNVNYLSANVSNVEYLSANVSNVEYLSANVSNVDYLSANVSNVNHLSANVGNVDYMNVNHKMSAPEFTDGHLSIMNGTITGLNKLELNGALLYCENGKMKFQYEGKTFVMMTET